MVLHQGQPPAAAGRGQNREPPCQQPSTSPGPWPGPAAAHGGRAALIVQTSPLNQRCQAWDPLISALSREYFSGDGQPTG